MIRVAASISVCTWVCLDIIYVEKMISHRKERAVTVGSKRRSNIGLLVLPQKFTNGRPDLNEIQYVLILWLYSLLQFQVLELLSRGRQLWISHRCRIIYVSIVSQRRGRPVFQKFLVLPLFVLMPYLLFLIYIELYGLPLTHVFIVSKIDVFYGGYRLSDPWILRGDPVRELSERDLTISVQVHAPDDCINVTLLEVFLETRHELSNVLKIKVAMSLSIDHCKGSYC